MTGFTCARCGALVYGFHRRTECDRNMSDYNKLLDMAMGVLDAMRARTDLRENDRCLANVIATVISGLKETAADVAVLKAAIKPSPKTAAEFAAYFNAEVDAANRAADAKERAADAGWEARPAPDPLVGLVDPSRYEYPRVYYRGSGTDVATDLRAIMPREKLQDMVNALRSSGHVDQATPAALQSLKKLRAGLVRALGLDASLDYSDDEILIEVGLAVARSHGAIVG